MHPSPVLITGSQRSGTTWVSRVLSHSSRVSFVDEPFNPIYRPSRVAPSFDVWFQYVCNENAEKFVRRLTRAYGLHYPLLQGRSLRGRGEWRRFGTEAVTSVFHRVLGDRIVCKDPIAVFSVPWLVETFGVKVIICVRHPAAFVSSNLKLGWEFDFRNLLDQPLFMRECAGDLAEEIERMAAMKAPAIDQSILLWRIIYTRVHWYSERFPDWVIIRHEDIARAPGQRFAELASRCGLAWNPTLAEFADRSSNASNPSEVPLDRWNSVFRDSGVTTRLWHQRLSEEQIRQVHDGTEREASWFYTAQDWAAA